MNFNREKLRQKFIPQRKAGYLQRLEMLTIFENFTKVGKVSRKLNIHLMLCNKKKKKKYSFHLTSFQINLNFVENLA